MAAKIRVVARLIRRAAVGIAEIVSSPNGERLRMEGSVSSTAGIINAGFDTPLAAFERASTLFRLPRVYRGYSENGEQAAGAPVGSGDEAG